MPNHQDVATTLQDALRLALPPIAVAVTDTPPAGVPRFGGSVPAGCVFWQEAAKGPFVTSTADHALCAIGVHTHHLEPASPEAQRTHQAELGQVLQVMAGLTYVREQDVAGIPVLPRPARHVVYAPLAQAPVEPDVVLLFAHSQQGLVITEALQQVFGDVPPAMGRPACAAIPQAVVSGRAALSLGCCGARAYLDALTDDVALWAVPGARIAEVAERIAALARANVILGRFHQLRRQDVEAGRRPTVEESLARLGG